MLFRIPLRRSRRRRESRLLVSCEAAADEPVETAIKGWVASIDASPDWQAAYKSLTYDATTRQATLSGLTIRSRAPGIDVNFGTIAVTGYAAAADGGFTAERITADEGALEMGPFKVALSDAEVNALAIPALPAFAWDAQHPATSMIKAYGPLSRVAMTNGRIGSVGLIQNNSGVNSRVVYNQLRIDRWGGGKIAGVTAGPVTMESPSPDGLMTMKVASLESHDIDIDAALRVLDPDRYVAGAGDGVWHTVTGLAAYHDFTVAGPGISLSMKLLSIEGLKLRQPPHSFTGVLDRILLDPNAAANDQQVAQDAVNMLSAYGLGRFGISGLDIVAAGIKTFHLGGLNLSDLSLDRLGEFAVDDFAGEIEDVGAMKLGHFALGDIVFPGAEALLQAAASAGRRQRRFHRTGAQAGLCRDVGVRSLAGGRPRSRWASSGSICPSYVGAVPTAIAAEVGDLVLPVSLLNPSEQAPWPSSATTRSILAISLKAKWNAADESVAVDRMQFQSEGCRRARPGDGARRPAARGNREAAITLRRAARPFAEARDADAQGRLHRRQGPRHAGREDARPAGKVPPAVRRRDAADAVAVRAARPEGGDDGAPDRQILAKLAPVVKAFVARAGIVDHRRAQAAEAGRLPGDLGCSRQRAGLADHHARPDGRELASRSGRRGYTAGPDAATPQGPALRAAAGGDVRQTTPAQ